MISFHLVFGFYNRFKIIIFCLFILSLFTLLWSTAGVASPLFEAKTVKIDLPSNSCGVAGPRYGSINGMSSDGHWLLLSCTTNSPGQASITQLYRVDTVTNHAQPLSPMMHWPASMSPNGKYVVFATANSELLQGDLTGVYIYDMEKNGNILDSTLVMKSSSSLKVTDLSIANDGVTVLVERGYTENCLAQIVLHKVNVGHQNELFCGLNPTTIDMNEDGSVIVINANYAGKGGALYAYYPLENRKVELFSRTNASGRPISVWGGQPTISDDGKVVVYKDDGNCYDCAVYVVAGPAELSATRRITVTETSALIGYEPRPQVSPDGKHFVYFSMENDRKRVINVYEMATDRIERISIDPDGNEPTSPIFEGGISTNACHVLFRSDDNIFLRKRCPTNELPTPVTPLIFIPGIAGSALIERKDGNEIERWPGICNGQSPLSLSVDPLPNIIPTDAIRGANFCLFDIIVDDAYGTLLAFLKNKQGYIEYKKYKDYLEGTCQPAYVDPDTGRKPNLFVFAYDWRKDNIESAEKLKEYIACVQDFYPNSKINILAHSMGGLIARRYILNNLTSHNVNTLITVGTPWLGAPKLTYVLESGDFVPSTTNEVASNVIPTFPGAYQLLPSRLYFTLTEGKPWLAPFVESGWDVNKSGNGARPQIYSYDELISMVDDRYQAKQLNLGRNSQEFHDYAVAGALHNKQDDWRSDDTGVRYYHIVGVQGEPRTIGQVRSRPAKLCGPSHDPKESFICGEEKFVFEYSVTTGDATVPYLSAARPGYNATASDVIVHQESITETDKLLDHTGLTRNPVVQDEIIKFLESPPVVAGSSIAHLGQSPLASEPKLIHQVMIVGMTEITIQGGIEKSIAHISGTLEITGSILGVDVWQSGREAVTILLSINEPYTLTFQTPVQPVEIGVRTTNGITISQSIAYSSLSLPSGLATKLSFSDQGIPELRYDSDNDSVFEQLVNPTVFLTGLQAQDIEAPQILVDVLQQLNQSTVTLTAVDLESGVNGLYYSFDGQGYDQYVTPIQVSTTDASIISVIADDNAANRSVREFALNSNIVYLPLVQK